MTKFVLIYRGTPQFKSKEEGAAHMEAWRKWSQGLGEAVLDPGMPVGPSKTVGADGVRDTNSSNPVSGITIVQAETVDQVLAMAKACPHIQAGGTIEVAEAMNMEM